MADAAPVPAAMLISLTPSPSLLQSGDMPTTVTAARSVPYRCWNSPGPALPFAAHWHAYKARNGVNLPARSHVHQQHNTSYDSGLHGSKCPNLKLCIVRILLLFVDSISSYCPFKSLRPKWIRSPRLSHHRFKNRVQYIWQETDCPGNSQNSPSIYKSCKTSANAGRQGRVQYKWQTLTAVLSWRDAPTQLQKKKKAKVLQGLVEKSKTVTCQWQRETRTNSSVSCF